MPGFRPERCDRSLATELDRQSQKTCNDFEKVNRQFNAAAE